MGQDTQQQHYSEQQTQKFQRLLVNETKLLKSWIQTGYFDHSTPLRCGYEVEGWIINTQGNPYPYGEHLLKAAADSHITPELSKFNFEINGNPCDVNNHLPEYLRKDFEYYWGKCSRIMAQYQGRILAIGCYPDLAHVPFGPHELSPQKRYLALNNQLQKLRQGPAHIHIEGRESLICDARNLVFEAQATSLQIHLQVAFPRAKDIYNASLILSPIMSALCANAPYVFGKELWSESRIPVFEQSVSLNQQVNGQKFSRVGLGQGFVQHCISELFEQNLHHPVLLPEIKNEQPEKLEHMLFHNGTIWRWNRPIIGIDQKGYPHFRIEHRIPSTGPSLIDMQANILFFIGLVHFIERFIREKGIPFTFQEVETAFYRCSQEGITAKITWIDGKNYRVCDLVAKKLVPIVRDELKQLSLTCNRADDLINEVIKNRAKRVQNGSVWQRAFVAKFGKDFHSLIQQYWEYQHQDLPVYSWEVAKCSNN